MTDKRPPVSAEMIEKVRNWTCNQFAMSDANADVPRLLRKVADTIDELGAIDILDVTFCLEIEAPETEAKMAVYFSFPEPEPAED